MLGNSSSTIKKVEDYSVLSQEGKYSLEDANAFYSHEYKQYEESRGSKVFYLYDSDYVQVVSIHKIASLFCVASLLSEPVCISDRNGSERSQFFIDSVVDYLKKEMKIDWIGVTPASSLFKVYPSTSERICFGNYLIDLSLPEENLFSNVTSKHRNMIRRGEKSEVTVCFGGLELLNDYIKVDKQTWLRSGKEIDNTEFYTQYIQALPNHTIVGIAYKEGVPQCGIIGLYSKECFYYMYGASADSPIPGATHYLQWKMICLMKGKGVHYYNFVGCRINEDADSKYHNIQHFKKGFGGVLEECYLFRVTANPLKKKLFNLLMKIKTGSIPNDVIDQEISKWKQIN